MMKSEYSVEYTNRQRNRSPLRKFIRKFYLSHTLGLSKGLAIDFGCGIGELLELLPKGSLGLEINKASVSYCKNLNMNVSLYNPNEDKYTFSSLGKNHFDTFIMSHVLEHLEDPKDVLLKIMSACNRLGIERIVIVVPGYKGFLYDKTHKTFINKDFIIEKNLINTQYYDLISLKYFPFNLENVGRVFTHNETVFVYENKKK